MSKFFKETKKKVKKTATNLFRPSREGSRAASPSSPSPSQHTEHSATPAPATEPQSPLPVAFSAMTQTMMAPTSVPSQLPSPTAADTSSPPLRTHHPATPAYARPPSPTTILATTGSAVKGLLVAARDGSDLFLPLKAALVGVLAIWDIFDVRYFTRLLSTT